MSVLYDEDPAKPKKGTKRKSGSKKGGSDDDDSAPSSRKKEKVNPLPASPVHS